MTCIGDIKPNSIAGAFLVADETEKVGSEYVYVGRDGIEMKSMLQFVLVKMGC